MRAAAASHRKIGLLALQALAAFVLATSATAQPANPGASTATRPNTPAVSRAGNGPAWSALTPVQQKALEPLRGDWAGIDSGHKAKWLDVAARLPSLPIAEQQRVRERMAEWARLTPTQRGQARMQFQESRQFSGTDRRALWDTYQSLPEDAKRQLADRGRPAAVTKAPAAQPTPGTSGAKRNVVAPTVATAVKPVAPTVVQSKPGATTTLVTRPASPPLHQQAGLPKIAATAGFVNPSTLLPQRGPQGAAVKLQPVPLPPAASAAAPAPAVSADPPAPAASAPSTT